MFNIETLKVGDEVGYARYYSGTLMNYGFSNVVKINKFGHIMLENGKSYDKHGVERKSPYSYTYLYSPKILRQRLAERDAKHQNQNMWQEVSKVVTTYESSSKYGIQLLTEEEWEKLSNMINNLRCR
jgi:hypothetical protein